MGTYLSKLKYRFDLGSHLLSIISLSLLVISAGDKLTSWIGIETKYLVLILVPLSLVTVYAFGWFLDKIKFAQGYNKQANLRNEQIEEILQILRFPEGVKTGSQELNYNRAHPKYSGLLYPVEKDLFPNA